MIKFANSEMKRIINLFDNWATRNPAILKLIENQNELIEKIEELENRIEFLEPSKEE